MARMLDRKEEGAGCEGIADIGSILLRFMCRIKKTNKTVKLAVGLVPKMTLCVRSLSVMV